MLLLTIKKNISLLFPKNTPLFRFSSSSASPSLASKTLKPQPLQPNLISEYLINSCGLSSQKASIVLKQISKSTCINRADSVRHFFKHHGGLTDTHIRKLISNYPCILHADVDKTLKPNLQILRAMGFTEEELPPLFMSNPSVLVNPSAIPRLEFWQNFVGTDNRKDLVMVFSRNPGLIARDLELSVAPKIALLKEYGVSETEIVRILKRGHGFIRRSIESVQALLKKVQELGFDAKSKMFGQALSSLSSLGMSTIEEKMEFFQGFGWSREQFLSAFKKAPYFMHLSKENVQEKMDFLVKEACCEQSYIASNPLLLMFSLEKRLKPRYQVLRFLKSNEIVHIRSLWYVMSLSDKIFLQNIVLRHKKQVPNIHEIYLAACAGQMQI